MSPSFLVPDAQGVLHRWVPVVAVAVAFAAGGAARAHDFWIEPARYTTEPKTPLTFDIKVGSGQDVEIRAWNPAHVERCFATDGTTTVEIGGEGGAIPAGRVELPSDGLWTIAYRSRESKIELEPAKFEAYLKEEGLDAIIAERAKLGESASPGRERYSRCAKTLVRVAAGAMPSASSTPAPVGLPLEIVVETDLGSLDTDDPTPVRLLLRGEAKKDMLLRATRLEPGGRTVSARTDEQGRAAFALDAGPWLIAAVHMERAAVGSHEQWVSLWATLTLERPGPPKPIEKAKPVGPPKSSGTNPDGGR